MCSGFDSAVDLGLEKMRGTNFSSCDELAKVDVQHNGNLVVFFKTTMVWTKVASN